MKDKLTVTRLVLAVISTGLEEAAIWAIWRWALPDAGIRLPLLPLILVMIAWAAFGTWLFFFTTRAIKRQVQAGQTSMVGTRGIVSGALNPEGMVKIRGELWKAEAGGETMPAGTEVVVVGENGLKLTVRKANGERPQ